MTWSDTAIDVSDDTVLSGSRVIAVQTTSANSNRLITSTWIAPTGLDVTAPASAGQVRVTGHHLAQIPNLHVQTQNGSWASFSNPRTARSSAGVVSWTDDTVTVQKAALAGQQLQRVRLSESAQPTAAYIAEAQTAIIIAGGVRPSISFSTVPQRQTLETSGYASFTVFGSPDTVTCQLDGAAPTSCTSGTFSFSGLADGNHTLNIHAANSAGSQDADTSWTVLPFKVHTDGLAAELVIDYRSSTVNNVQLMGTATLSDGATVNVPFGQSVYSDAPANITPVSYPNWSLSPQQTANLLIGAHRISQPTGGDGGSARASIVDPVLAGRTITKVDLYSDSARTQLVGTQDLGAGITVPALPAWFEAAQFRQETSTDSSYLASHPVAAWTIQVDNIYAPSPVFSDFTEVRSAAVSDSGQTVQLIGHLPARYGDSLRIYDVSARSMKLQALGLSAASGPWRMKGILPYVDNLQLNTYGYDATTFYQSHRLLPTNDTDLNPAVSEMHVEGHNLVISGERLRWLRSTTLREQDGWSQTTTFMNGTQFGSHSFYLPISELNISGECTTFSDAQIVCPILFQYSRLVAGAANVHIGSNTYDAPALPDFVLAQPQALIPTQGYRITSATSTAPGTLRVEGVFPHENTQYLVTRALTGLTTNSTSTSDVKFSTPYYDQADDTSPLGQGVVTITGLNPGDVVNVLRMSIVNNSSGSYNVWLDIPNVTIQ